MDSKMKRTTAILLLVLTVALVNGAAQRSDQGEILLKAAIQKETVDGDLKAAIEQYKNIISSGTSSRAVVARALLQLAGCYEKQGNAEAQKLYEQLINEFRDLSEITVQANTRLNQLVGQNHAAMDQTAISMRQFEPDIVFDDSYPTGISPDGRYISCNDSDGNISIYDVSTKASRKLTRHGSQESNANAHFSPDGSKVAFQFRNGQSQGLKVMNNDGSSQRVFYSADTPVSIEDWFPDNRHVLAIKKDNRNWPQQLIRISIDDGSLSTILPKVGLGRYQVSPDGRHIVIFHSFENDGSKALVLIPSSGGSEVTLFKEKGMMDLIGWDRQGRSVLFLSDRSGSSDIWRIVINDGRPIGEAGLVKSYVGGLRPLGSTRSGSIFFSEMGLSTDVFLGTIDWKTGNLTTTPIRADSRHIGFTDNPSWSPDGAHLAYLASATPNERFISSIVCIRSEKDGQTNEFRIRYLLDQRKLWWSADGQFLFGTTRLGTGSALVRINSTTGNADVLTTLSVPGSIFACAPDGKTAFIQRSEQSSRVPVIYAHDVATGRETELYRSDGPLSASDLLRWGQISPDGRWLSIVRSVSLDRATHKYRSRLLLVPTSMGRVQEILSREGFAISPVAWLPDGKSILFSTWSDSWISETEQGIELYEIPMEGGTPRRLGQVMQPYLKGMSLNPDGRRIAYAPILWGKDTISVLENLPPAKDSGK